MLGDPRDAEEAAQDALVRAYRALAGYDAARIRELRLRPWLATIVLNLCRSRLARRPRPAADRPVARRARCRATLEPRTDGRARPGGRRRARDAAADDWADLLLTLPPAYRSAVVLRHVDGLSLSRTRHRPRSTRGHRQGPGPSRPGPVAHGVRGRPAARTRGDDRMTTDDRTIETALAGLRDDRSRHASPRTSSPRSAWPTCTPASTRRSGRWSWPGTGSASRPSRRPRTTPTFEAQPRGPDRAPGTSRRAAARRVSAAAIARRLDGDRRVRIDLDLRGHTDFERDVWHKALEIPRGEVRPYGWVAAEIGRPKAVRAVGTALGHNPVPLIVPCHRVVRTRRHASASTRSAGRRTSGRSWRAEGLDPDGDGAAAPVRHPVHRLGHDPDRLPADLPRTPRVTDRIGSRSARSRARAGRRAIARAASCRPASGVRCAA